jgi:aminoglycoside 3-N-acetyltransferase I
VTAPTVRRLGSGETGCLQAANALFGRVFEDSAYWIDPPRAHYLNRLLANDSFIALVAEQDGRMVGALAGYELVKFEAERSEIYIYDLAVDEAARRQGTATMLIEWLRDYAASIGAWVIYVQADPPDAPAVALYEKLGTREEVYHFDISPAGDRRSTRE